MIVRGPGVALVRWSGGRRAVGAAGCVLAASLLVGCGANGPELAPLSGTISLDGQPLPHGLVQFVPASGAGPAAVGSIAAGRFTAETGGRRGAVPGRYLVRVEARAKPVDETDTLPKSLVPARYGDPATSGIVAEVVVGQDNVVDITLGGAR